MSPLLPGLGAAKDEALQGFLGRGWEEAGWLGMGARGSVLKVQRRGSQAASRPSALKRSTLAEVRALRALAQCRNIVALEETFAGDGPSDVWARLECLEGGTLRSMMRDQKPLRLTQDVTHFVLREILAGLQDMHQKGWMHRDIKAENIGVSDSCGSGAVTAGCVVKLLDFDTATMFTPGYHLNEVIGTVENMAPEVFARSYDERADCWSLGIVTYEVLFGYRPFNDASLDGVEELVRNWERYLSIPDEAGQGASAFVRALLTESESRMTSAAAARHAWLQGSSRSPRAAVAGPPQGGGAAEVFLPPPEFGHTLDRDGPFLQAHAGWQRGTSAGSHDGSATARSVRGSNGSSATAGDRSVRGSNGSSATAGDELPRVGPVRAVQRTMTQPEKDRKLNSASAGGRGPPGVGPGAGPAKPSPRGRQAKEASHGLSAGTAAAPPGAALPPEAGSRVPPTTSWPASAAGGAPAPADAAQPPPPEAGSRVPATNWPPSATGGKPDSPRQAAGPEHDSPRQAVEKLSSIRRSLSLWTATHHGHDGHASYPRTGLVFQGGVSGAGGMPGTGAGQPPSASLRAADPGRSWSAPSGDQSPGVGRRRGSTSSQMGGPGSRRGSEGGPEGAAQRPDADGARAHAQASHSFDSSPSSRLEDRHAAYLRRVRAHTQQVMEAAESATKQYLDDKRASELPEETAKDRWPLRQEPERRPWVASPHLRHATPKSSPKSRPASVRHSPAVDVAHARAETQDGEEMTYLENLKLRTQVMLGHLKQGADAGVGWQAAEREEAYSGVGLQEEPSPAPGGLGAERRPPSSSSTSSARHSPVEQEEMAQMHSLKARTQDMLQKFRLECAVARHDHHLLTAPTQLQPSAEQPLTRPASRHHAAQPPQERPRPGDRPPPQPPAEASAPSGWRSRRWRHSANPADQQAEWEPPQQRQRQQHLQQAEKDLGDAGQLGADPQLPRTAHDIEREELDRQTRERWEEMTRLSRRSWEQAVAKSSALGEPQVASPMASPRTPRPQSAASSRGGFASKEPFAASQTRQRPQSASFHGPGRQAGVAERARMAAGGMPAPSRWFTAACLENVGDEGPDSPFGAGAGAAGAAAQRHQAPLGTAGSSPRRTGAGPWRDREQDAIQDMVMRNLLEEEEV